MSLFAELKRRNVIRVAIAYGVAAWLLLQLTDIVAPILQLPDSIPRTVLFLLVIGFIPAVILAWAFEMTPEGVKRESDVDRSTSITSQTGRKLDRAIIGVLVVAISFLLVDKFVLQDESTPDNGTVIPANANVIPANANVIPAKANVIPAKAGTHSEASEATAIGATGKASTNPDAAATATQNSVAVLPFIAMSNGPDDDYFSDGLTEEIINALAQLPELLVTARTSAFHFKGQNVPIGQIAGQLGVDHIVEGSVRRAGDQLRITAQLVRAEDGFHLWSESYNRRTEDTFAVQLDIAEKVAMALNVILDEDQRKLMQQVGVRNVEAFTAYQKGRALYDKAHGDGDMISRLRQSNRFFEDAIELAPDFSDAYLHHSDLYSHILMTEANGQLDGNIGAEDVRTAPAGIRHDYDPAIQHARNSGQRRVAEFDRVLLLGEWRGLASLSDRALVAPSCEVALWAHLTSSAFGRADLLHDAFSRLAACDPVSPRPRVHLAYSGLWLGQARDTIELAEARMQDIQHHSVLSAYITALATLGRMEEAEQAASTLLQDESERLFMKSLLAAMRGDRPAAESFQDRYLGKFGPNDYTSLMMEAARGNRNEADRLAGRIDSRPFGYMALMQAVYYCLCGPPFDLEATPVLASMLADSGLPWPPVTPVNFPLKDW